MRIVQIGSYPKNAGHIAGGVEASVYGLAQIQSFDNEVFAFDMPRMGGKQRIERDGNVTVYRFANRGRRQISSAKQVKQIVSIICSLSPDVCHIHGTSLFAWRMFKEFQKVKIPMVVTIHGLALVEKRNALKKDFSIKKLLQFFYQSGVEKRFLSSLPVAIVDTEYVKQMVDNYPIKKKPIMHVIPQGINEEYFQISCSEESFTLLSVGSIGERKGHLLTLESFERVRKIGIDCKLLIAGTLGNVEYNKNLQYAIENSEFKEDIELLIDIEDKKLKQLYKDSHVFVLHTEEESQGIVFAEAMATGMPVVATCVGGVPFVVKDGVTGLLSPYGDVKRFSDSLIILLSDKRLWKSMSVAAKQNAVAYHWQVISNEIMKIYCQ